MAEPHARRSTRCRLDEARAALARCCGADALGRRHARAAPVRLDGGAVHGGAPSVWARARARRLSSRRSRTTRAIGADVARCAQRFAGDRDAGRRRSRPASPAPTTRRCDALRDGNSRYATRFGFIFIVCATGKSAGEMLALLRARLGNDPDAELRDRRRRAGARSPACAWRSSARMSPITTHVLDTALGRPARGPGACASTCSTAAARWRTLAERVTNADGRVADLVAAAARSSARHLPPDVRHRRLLRRAAAARRSTRASRSCSPSRRRRASTTTCRCCLSPFGYSTYRGS